MLHFTVLHCHGVGEELGNVEARVALQHLTAVYMPGSVWHTQPLSLCWRNGAGDLGGAPVSKELFTLRTDSSGVRSPHVDSPLVFLTLSHNALSKPAQKV